MSSISFDNPWLLFLLIPLFALVLAPFFITVRKTNLNWHNVTSCALHLVMCLSIVFALCGMSFESVITETNVFVVADVSYSANRNLEQVDEYIRKIEQSLPGNARMGVIGFGRNYALLTDLGEGRRSVSNLVEGNNPVIDQSATDIAAAMRYAGNLFDDEVIKRIVVITDGVETVSTNDTIKVVNALRNDGVIIDAVFLNDNISENVNEVQVDGVEATKSTYVDKAEQANVLIRSNNAQRTRNSWVTLLCNGQIVARRAESFDKGLNVVTFDLDTSEAGEFNYTVRLEFENEADDTASENNEYYFTQSVSDDVKVLFIGGSEYDLMAGRLIYGTENVTFISNPNAIPLTVEDLCVYDEIAISNFNLSEWGASLTFLNCLNTAVMKFGKTLTTYGNTYIQNTFSEETPNEALTQLSGMLPVNIGNDDKDERIIVLLLDISTSGGFSGRLSTAKEAAIALLNTFGQNDTVMVVGFSGDRITYCEPTKLKSRKVLIEAINNITVRNGTLLNSAMQTAFKAIKESGAPNRELIILSDGIINSAGEKSACNTLAQEMSGTGGNVIISALGMFPATADEEFLEGLVNNPKASGKGFYQSIKNESEIEYTIRSFTEEQAAVKIEGETYPVKINRKDEELVKGLTEVERVSGFWASSEKFGSTVVLSATYMRNKTTPVDAPLYAYWNYGNGKVVSVLTDISPSSNWISSWGSNTSGRQVLSNIKAATLPDECTDTPLIIQTEIKGLNADISVTTAAVYSDASLSVTLIAPDGTETTKPLNFATEDYRARFETTMLGTFTYA
ncbi:MAG: VWA domain-containing protein [Clostridia bacterium]|nr:VWA domain-containing protein [Clostridia bacterium]